MKLIAIIIVIGIIMTFSISAQYETLAGIPADSPDYSNYITCVDSCGQCETSCKANTYRMAAETQNKEEFCNYLPEAEKQLCKERIYMTKAITEKDSAECQKITNENEKQGCLLNVQTEKAIADGNEAECNSLEADFAENCKMAFNQRMAMQTGDRSYCEKITDENAKESCISTVAMMTPSAEIPAATEENSAESGLLSKNKSLIIYGIIILGVIIIAVIAIVIIKKIGGKKPAQAPLMVQQQKFPPLVMQQNPQMQQGDKK
ncbi:MAG: hypothetical protein WC852_04235 [Candidatus Nanoarchaeia archaeon]|jgi:hypothetical protein